MLLDYTTEILLIFTQTINASSFDTETNIYTNVHKTWDTMRHNYKLNLGFLLCNSSIIASSFNDDTTPSSSVIGDTSLHACTLPTESKPVTERLRDGIFRAMSDVLLSTVSVSVLPETMDCTSLLSQFSLSAHSLFVGIVRYKAHGGKVVECTVGGRTNTCKGE